MKKSNFRKNAAAAAFLFIMALSYASGCGGGENIALPGGESSGMPESLIMAETPETQGIIVVHVCGEVKNPGVFELPEGSRLVDAVELAGGFTEEAADSYLNLAAVLSDGEQVRVPDREEADFAAAGMLLQDAGNLSRGAEPSGTGGKVNLNTASKEALMTLPGIGEAKAEAVIRYREEHGGFQKTEDIMKVPGIKQSAFEKIREKITV